MDSSAEQYRRGKKRKRHQSEDRLLKKLKKLKKKLDVEIGRGNDAHHHPHAVAATHLPHNLAAKNHREGC